MRRSVMTAFAVAMLCMMMVVAPALALRADVEEERDTAILRLRRLDAAEDEKIMQSIDEAQEEVEEAMHSQPDPVLVEHSQEMERLEDAVDEEDRLTEELDHVMLETSRSRKHRYSPALLARVNEALKAHDISTGVTELARPKLPKHYPKIRPGVRKTLDSEIALGKVREELFDARNTKRAALDEYGKLADDLKYDIARSRKRNGLKPGCKK